MITKPITAFCSLNMGQSPDSKTYNTDGVGVPFYQGNADFGDLHPVTRVWCSQPVKKAKPGDILISVRAPIGAMNIATEVCCIGRGLAALTPNADTRQKYLYYAIQSRVDSLIAQGTGSTFKAISKKILEETLIPDYSPSEQDEIVTKIGLIDSAIASRQEQLQLLDQLVKSRFVELFGDTILNPFGWDKNMLGSVCDVRDGTHDSPQYYETGYPLVTSKNVTGGKIDLTGCSLICEADFKKINERSKVDIGDIIMPMIGTVGKPVVVDIEPNFAIKNVALIKFKTDSKVLNIYIRALLQSDYFDDAVLSKVRGGTQKFISLGDIRKLEVLVPPMEVQNQFATFVEQTDKSKFEIQKSLEKLETLKKALMQKYFG
jgi:type I restriction enzyme S subunit